MTSEQKKNKQLLFLIAQPRSGNTLFASIMNQNPEIAATPNSITLEIMKDLFLLLIHSKSNKRFSFLIGFI